MRIAWLALALALALPVTGAAQDASESAADDEAAAAIPEEPASDGELAGDGDAASDDAASDDAASEDVASEDTPEASDEPEARAAEPASHEPDANVPRTDASGVLGIVTVLAAVGAVAGIGYWVERDDSVGRCAAYELEAPRYRGCLNVGAIRDQRDVGAGLAIGFGALTVGAAIAWVIVATTSQAPAESAFACAPGVLSLACTGRF